MRKNGVFSGYFLKRPAAGRAMARMRRNALAVACAPLAWLAFSSPVALGQTAPAAGVSKPNNELVQTFCVKCHNSEDWAGSLDMDAMDLNHPGQNPEVWEKAITKLRGRLMPPAGQKQPAQGDIDKLVGYLEKSVDAAAQEKRIGHVPIQRLNRTEFATSVKSLIGVDIDPKQALPNDIEVEGFNNIAGALGISPSFMEQYLSAARRAAHKAVGEPVPKLASTFYAANGGGGGGPGFNSGQVNHRDGFPLGTRGGMSFTHVFPADGEYRFDFLDADNLNAGLYPFGMLTEATMIILVDGVEVARRNVGGPDDLALTDREAQKGREAIVKKMTFSAQVPAGKHQIIATYIERSWALSNDAAGGGRIGDMPVTKGGMQVVGPFTPHGLSMSESRAKIFVCQPNKESEEKPCAERIAKNLATKAFRRPVTDADVSRLMKFYADGRAEAGGFDSGVTELVTAVLSSPDFLYRAISTSPAPNESRKLSDLELASRLSFLMWSQGPDEQLLALAAKGKLSDVKVLQAQVERMLKDPRGQSLVENFALAWLNLDELYQVEPTERGFNAGMRGNFETEIRLFLSSVLLKKRSVLDLLNADWTFVNDALATQYGIPGVYGPQFREVKLADENRWGLLGKGAVLLRTSYADRTSIVLRGAWVLDRIMGTPPTPPPPNVNTDISVREGEAPTTVRARMEKHRENPICKGCHGLIDPPGLALENFDVTGRWRDVDAAAKAKIDSTTELTSGVVLHGPIDLRHFLTSRQDQFPTTVTKRLMMYALNREVEYYDMPQVREIVRKAAAKNYTFASIITGVVMSDEFRRQGPEAPLKNKVASSASAGATASTQ
jgi:hypothetical protein